MYEFRYDPLPDVDAYLARIQYTGSTEPTLENLNALVRQHQLTVPFENLDCCMTNTPISLDINHLFDKIVTRRRGGYCFEMNGIFATLLIALGYDAYSCFCRVSGMSDSLRPIRHRGCIVTIEGKRYFCDVGFGGAMAPFAVEFSEERQVVDGETYWIEPAEMGWFQLCRLSGTGLQDDGSTTGVTKSVAFIGPMAALAEDFEPYSYACWAMPDSRFRQAANVAIRHEDGYVTLKGMELVTKHGSSLTARTITQEELPAVLEEEFGIRL